MEITYNSITFDVVKTNRLVFEPVWTPDNTTYMYTRVFLDVEGLLNPRAMAYTQQAGAPALTPGALPPTTLVAIRHALEQPRARLAISTATGLLPLAVVTQPDGTLPTDCNNGPKPGPCTIMNFMGARTWYIHWTCETWIHECPSGEPSPSPLLSNRYSQEDRVDDQFRSTRVTTGTAFFRTDLLSTDNTEPVADSFRAQVMPPVPRGFRRTRVNVQVVPSRNALQWSCADEEQFYDLGDTQATGSFITKAVVHFQLSSLLTDKGVPGGQSLGHCRVALWGDKRASEWTMIQRAFALAAGVLPLGSPNAGYIQQIAIGKVLTDRQIDLNIVYLFVAPATSPYGGIPVDTLRKDTGAVFPDFGGVNPGPPWGKGSRGTSNLKVLAAALESACTGAAVPPSTQPGSDGGSAQYDGPPPAVTVEQGDELPEYPTRYKEGDGKPGPYNEYHIESRYRRREHRIMTAPTGPPPGGAGGAPAGHSDPVTGDWIPDDPAAATAWPAVFFQIAGPTATLVVHWRAERVGFPPQVPSPGVNDANLVLLDQEVVPIAPQVLPADGQTLVYRVEGEYTYGMKVAYSLDKALSLGVVPWLAAEFTEMALQPADFSHGIIDDLSGSSSESPGPSV